MVLGAWFNLVKAMVEAVFGGDSTKTTAQSVFMNLSSPSSQFHTVWATVENIYNQYLVPFVFCILLFMFFYALVDKMSTTELSFEVVGGMVCKLMLLCAFAEVSLTLAKYIIQIADGVIDLLANYANTGAAGAQVVDSVLALLYPNGTSWDGWLAGIYEVLDSIVPVLALIIPWLVTLICEAIVKIVTLTREIEIYTRAAFLPVALGDSYNGVTSGGARFLKNFLAVCLQGALIVVILIIADAMSAAYITNISVSGSGIDAIMGVVIMPIIYRVAATGLILKSMPLAKEICGVG